LVSATAAGSLFASTSGAADFGGSSSAYLKASQLNVQSMEIEAMIIWIGSTGAAMVSGLSVEGRTGCGSRTPGMNLQIGEKILFKVIRFRHFGLILYFGD